MMSNFKDTNQQSGKAIVGFVLLVIGSLLLLRSLDLLFLPRWIFSIPVFIILIGVFIGARQNFRSPVPIVLIAIGSALLVKKIFPELHLGGFIWPGIIIGFGLYMIFGRRGNTDKSNNLSPGWDKRVDNEGIEGEYSEGGNKSQEFAEDRLNSISVFGGVKKNIFSKNFKGGEAVNFFGGSDFNLLQADIQGRAILDITQVFGGTKIIVPANWEVHSEMIAIFGGIDDKRPPQLNVTPNKILVIKGTSIFGGVNIRSY
ncbi:MAG: LiaF domain-containing protein [Daejeonella sp.]